jgi:hypothetical protein
MHSPRTLPQDHPRIRPARESRAIGERDHLEIVYSGNHVQNGLAGCIPELEMGFRFHAARAATANRRLCIGTLCQMAALATRHRVPTL